MKVIIIEDEKLSADRLQRLLSQIDSTIQVVSVLPSVAQSISWFQNNEQPDLIFMDIHLEDDNSFDIFKDISLSSPIIYTTAYEEYAITAFKQNSVDYLLKPLILDDLRAALDKYRNLFTLKESSSEHTFKERFLVKKGSQYISIATTDTAYFKSDQKLTFLITKENEKHIVDESLDQLSDMIDPKHFYRISRNRIVSIHQIHKIHSHFNGRLKLELLPSEDEEVFVSRERVIGFKNWLNK